MHPPITMGRPLPWATRHHERKQEVRQFIPLFIRVIRENPCPNSEGEIALVW
jgi:hypothetical protein